MTVMQPKDIGNGLLAVGDYNWLLVKTVEGGVEVSARCAARMSRYASVFIRTEDFPKIVVLRISYNARQSARIEGSAVLWSYADGHGMELVAILRRGGNFEMSIPRHHGHGSPRKYRGTVHEDGTVSLVELPSAPSLNIP